MNRENAERCLKHDGFGVEIGPRDIPIAPKRKGYKVHVIDHLDREGLVKKYTGHPVNLDRIEEVDFVWNGESYAELTGFPKHYDWVVASHVVEHTPDLVGFLNECDSILKDDGVLVLVVPDKRYCYDYFRPISGISKVIDAHLCKNKVHTIGTLVEDRLNASSRGGVISWSANATGEYRFEKNLDEVKNVMKEASESGCYIDSHAWCFVPNSFRLMIHDLYSLGLISFKEVNFFPTFGCEFCIVLGRKGRGVQMTRMEMLQQVDREICSTLPTFGRIWGLRLLNRIRRFI